MAKCSKTDMLCEKCGSEIQIVYFRDVTATDGTWMRGDYLYCPVCDKKFIVDDSFDYKIK